MSFIRKILKCQKGSMMVELLIIISATAIISLEIYDALKAPTQELHKSAVKTMTDVTKTGY